MIRLVSKLLLLLAAIVCALSLFAFADSQVRIVRLSDVDGNVQIDHGTGYENALRNSPIIQGMRLWTKDGALAEVEFESGTTLRLAPDTIVEFPELSLRDSGAKVSAVDIKQGTAYFNLNKQNREDEFRVSFGHERTTLKNSTRVRISLKDSKAEIAVTKGDVELEGPSGTLKVAKDRTLTLDLNANTYEVAKGVDSDQYDKWNQQESQYQRQYSNSVNGVPYSYGLSDLSYYGNYFFLPGYGYVWQPALVGAGWSPFSNGAWVWYPQFGYMWVSDYPWGWMPYRYGNWFFASGWGWFWQPGGFTSWNTTPIIRSGPAGFVPPRAPTIVAHHPTIPVNRTPIGVASPAVSPLQPNLRPGATASVPRSEVPVHGHSPAVGAISKGSFGERNSGAMGGSAIPRTFRVPASRSVGPRSAGSFGTTATHGASTGAHASSGAHSSSPHR